MNATLSRWLLASAARAVLAALVLVLTLGLLELLEGGGGSEI